MSQSKAMNLRRSFRLLFVVALAVFVLRTATSLSGANQASPGTDAFIGTWNLNLARSIYSPGPPPLSQTRIYEATPDGQLKATLITVDRQGVSSTIEYEAGYDGVEYPYLGSMNVDAIRLHRIDNNSMEATLSHAGVAVGTSRRVVSPDGRLMTITLRLGGNTSNLLVFDKQD